MANTFSQIYLQFVFAVKQRQSLIPKEHKKELHKYITASDTTKPDGKLQTKKIL